ncbi:MAG: Asp-tRNA(Asn)/Glu-tRNA(Gln) amidotransferase GatCAB subunit A [Deltaproteobacteria bacterium]|nr:MAG: Asp-tRNA(Asn)/Glu-tRNA(Gln) amidotransferase GatCAB subunit A [Deltaproteobacteria bacterium]
MSYPEYHTIKDLSEALRKKEVSSVEITRQYLDRISRLDDEVKAYLHVDEEAALRDAREADEVIRRGEATPLTGIPMGIKDVLCIEGVPTTCGSKILENYVPPYSATVIEKLRREHIVILGKLNMDEFAMGSSTENSRFQVTRNPWDLERIPGGSSGGSAAAVAAALCAAALGTDTGGSIRQPASLCGIVGMKPTYGTVSRFGLVAFASSLDQIGPMTRSVGDAALLLNTLAGHDPRDSTSVPRDFPDYTEELDKGLEGLRIGIPEEYFIEGIDPEVEAHVRKAIEAMKGAGAKVVEISLPHTEYAVATYYIIATAEASSNLARYDGVRYGYRDTSAKGLREMYEKTRSGGFGTEVKRRIMLGTYVLSAGYYDAYYRKGQQVRTLIREDFTKAFEACDVIVTPTAPTPAFKIGEKTEDPLQMYLSDIFTISVNLAGLPGISIPCGLTKENLPVGLQFIGSLFGERTMLRAARGYEALFPFADRYPEIVGKA